MDIERRTNWDAPVGTGPSLSHVVSNSTPKPVENCKGKEVSGYQREEEPDES